MPEVLDEIETAFIWCYCCEDFTTHEVYEDEDRTLYQCNCGCVVDDSEDEVLTPGY